MSGQEWVPDPADLRGDDRPLSPAVGPEPGNAPPPFPATPPSPPPPHFIGRPDDDPGPGDDPEGDADGEAEPEPEVRPRRAGFRFSMPRFRARRDDQDEAEEGVVEVMAGPDGDDPDAADPEGDDEAPAARRRFGLPFRLPRFRRGGGAAEAEAEFDPDAAESETPADPDAEYDPADEPEGDAAPARSGLLAGLALSREARVGLAAGVSFLILAAIWINNKGRAPTLAMGPPKEAAADGKPKPKDDGKAPEKPAAKPGDKPAVAEVAAARPEAPASAPAAAPKPLADPDKEFSKGAGEAHAATGALAQHGGPGEAPLPAAAPVPMDPPTPEPVKPLDPPAAAPVASGDGLPTMPPAAGGELPPIGTGTGAEVAATPGAPPLTPPDAPAGNVASGPAEPAAALPMPDPATLPGIDTHAPALAGTPAPSAEVKPSEPAPAATPDPVQAAPSLAPALGATEPAAPAPTLGATDPAVPTLPPGEPSTPAPPAVTAPPVEPQAPALVSSPAPAPAPVAPVRTPPLEPVPATAAEPATPAGIGDGVPTIQARARRPLVSTPRSAGEAAGAAGFGAMAGAAARKIADGPPPADDVAGRSQFEPKLHEVRSGENFWTISRRYYGTGRYYKALWAANSREVPVIEDLWVGAVVRVPPPETLNPKLVEPAPPASAKPRVADKTYANDVSRTSNDADAGEPRTDRIIATPSRPRRKPAREVDAPDEVPARPTYQVRANETLRSIARDTLGDSRRDLEILQLNRPQLRSASDLTAGMTITLPSDASTGRRRR